MSKIRAAIQSLPLFVRKFCTDTIETFIGALLVMSAADFADAGIKAFVVALAAAAVSAARRAAPAAILWLNDLFGTTEG